jgi:hypothetical protein
MNDENKPSLKSIMTEKAELRSRVVADCVIVLDGEVSRKKGVSGLLIKGGFKVIKSLKGGKMIAELIDWLLDEFVDALDPFYQEYMSSEDAQKHSFSFYICAHEERVAEALLSVTDRRRERAKNKVLIKTYDSLRSTALKHVREGVPAVGNMVEKYAFTNH